MRHPPAFRSRNFEDFRENRGRAEMRKDIRTKVVRAVAGGTVGWGGGNGSDFGRIIRENIKIP